ncbi:MAG: 2-octaprenyl-6-methoxyphenol hydroxylase [Alphaproteobacteria bacterium MarineAlpha9_Bin3]|nr:MAG: 2-octaprenyl-6-methoxyphenol hydroxylase [Alphaproteobacteria bacterium MarineAlpha9_Bin3]
MHTDIIICGGALAGMTLALSLQKKGLDVIIVDPRSVSQVMQDDKRTTAIAAGPKKFYDSLGVWKNLKDKVEAIDSINILDGSSSISLVFDYKDYLSKNNLTDINSLGYVVENCDLIKQIDLRIKNLKKCGKVKRIKSKVLNIKIDKSSAKLFLENKNIITASLVVAADGKNSVVRKMVGIRENRSFYDQEAYVTQILHQKNHNNIALEKFLPGGPLAVLPMKKYKKKYRSAIIWSDKEETTRNRLIDSKKNPNIISYELERHCFDWLGKIELYGDSKAFPLELIKPKNIVSERIVLMGDAAHAIHPIAGQGFNLSLRGMEKFSEMCSARVGLGLDIGSKIFLKDYEMYRKVDVASLINATHALNELFRNSKPHVKAFRRLGLATVSNTPILKRAFMKYAMGI